ncbi:hypothetical protein ACOBQJ_00685 [Pelotomaculum propionicicum]
MKLFFALIFVFTIFFNISASSAPIVYAQPEVRCDSAGMDLSGNGSG